MQIQILSVTIETKPTAKGSYQVADVAYKNLSFQGKVEGKKVMSFGATAEGFKVLALAQPGETYEVTVVKNDKGYNDWTALTKSGAGTPAAEGNATGSNGSAARAATSTPVRSTYETPEERAIKQVYIVKQSSVSNAIATLSVGAKKLEPADVLKLAQEYTDFVFGKTSGGKNHGPTGFDDFPDVPDEFIKPE
jgi:hypothetical protein